MVSVLPLPKRIVTRWRPLWLAGLLLTLLAGRPSWPVVAQEEEAGNVDIVLILDTSGSMTNNDPEALRVPAAKLFVDLARDGDKFGIVTMSGRENTLALTPELVPITGAASREQLKGLIEQARQVNTGGTFIGDALNLAYDLLAASPANQQRLVLLLTDGLPDPSSQREVVTEAVSRFQTQSGWPVFTVALGPRADAGYLESAITTPAGGQTFPVLQAGELVDLYLRLFELLLDDRYIEQVSVPLDELTPIVSLTDDHRLTQLSFILHRQEGTPTIETLESPTLPDLTQTSLRSAEVYYSADPAYELYTIFAGGDVEMVGDWAIALQGAAESGRVTLIARSELRARLLVPRPSNPDEERSLRFLPAGRPVYLQGMALDSEGGSALGMQPGLELPQGSEAWLLLPDDGQNWDLSANDGRYTAISDVSLPTGSYNLRIELPAANSRPIHLYKTYPVEVMPLPSLELTFLNEAGPFGVNDQLEGTLNLTAIDGIPLAGIEQLTVVARDPQGQLAFIEAQPGAAPVLTDTLPLTATATITPTPESSLPIPLPTIVLPPIGIRDTPTPEGQSAAPLYHFTYRPPANQNGTYTFLVLADVNVSDGQRLIPYTDFAQSDFVVTVPHVALAPTTNEITQAAGRKTQVRVEVTSDTTRGETLLVTATGLGLENLEVLPAELIIPPDQTTAAYNFDVFTDNPPGSEGQLTLNFASHDGKAAVEGQSINWTLRVVSGLQVTTDQLETEIMQSEGGEVIVNISSDSPRQEEITVSWEATGLGTVDILPAQITVPPGEQTPFTFRVYSDAAPGAEGEVTLTFTSPNETVAIANPALIWQATVRRRLPAYLFLLCGGALLLVGGLAFMVIRQRRQ